ncbi:MAG: L-threonylcarbamoyladenylate synthase [Anaerolineae bacterium]
MTVDPASPDPGAIAEAARELAAGRPVAFPTETVYGLGADAGDPAAVELIFAAKGRPADDPVIVHVLGLDDLREVSPLAPAIALELADRFWPGPLTLVVPRGPSVPPVVTAGLDSVAVRAPAHPVARELLRQLGRPIAAPSANPFGMTSPTTAQHVVDGLGDRIGLVLDGGQTYVGVESTVVDCRGEVPVVLRPGGVTLEQLAPWGAVQAPGETGADVALPRRSPGQMQRHYAPRAIVVVLTSDGRRQVPPEEQGAPIRAAASGAPGGRVVARALALAAAALAEQGNVVGILCADEDGADLELLLGERAKAPGPGDAGAPSRATVRVRPIGPLDRPEIIARQLFATMHELDAAGVDVILARSFGRRGLALAVDDRLARAAEGRIVTVGTGAEPSALSADAPLDAGTEAAAEGAAAAVIGLVGEATRGRSGRP